MESKNNTENSAINPEQFNFELFKVVDIKKRNPSDVQEYGFINYNGDKKPLTFRTGEVTLSTYGIPQEHPQYYETDDKRKFIKLPIYPNDSIYSMLNEIDEQFNSPEMKVKTFGKGADKYKYNPIIVTPEEEEGKVYKYERPAFIKVRLDLNQDKSIKTHLYHKTATGRERVPEEDCANIDDFRRYCCFKSTIKLAIVFSKIYKTSKKEFGFIMKAKQVYVVSSSAESRQSNNGCLFDDDEDDDSTTQVVSRMQKLSTQSMMKNVSDLDGNDDEDHVKHQHDDNEEDEEIHVAPKVEEKKSTKKGGKAKGNPAYA